MNAEKLEPAKKKPGSIFYGWWVILSGALIAALGTGSVYYGFNTFFSPMVEEFGWSRAATSAAFSLSRLEGGLEGPLVGWLIDRIGCRKLAIAGITMAGIGFFALTLVNGNIVSLCVIFGILLSMGYNTGFFHSPNAAAAKWFIKKRSRALSYVLAGGGIGGAVMVPFMAWMIQQWGWRTAAVVVGFIVLLIGIPTALLLQNSPEEKGLLPDGETETAKEPAAGHPETGKKSFLKMKDRKEASFTVRSAMKTGAFWTYSAAMLFRSCISSALVIHEIPHLVDLGISYEAASAALGTMILLSVPGRLVFGWLGDFVDKRLLLFICCLLQAIGLWIFIRADAIGTVYVFVAIFGLGYGGAIPLAQGLRADLFGRKVFATLGGITTSITTVGTVAAPVLAGYLYDVSKSYTFAFTVLMVLVAMSGVTFLIVREPKNAASPALEGATGE